MTKFKIGDEIINRGGKDQYDRVVIGYMSNGYVAYEYTSDAGRPILGSASEDCFVLKPTKKEGWLNIYTNNMTGNRIFGTPQLADDCADRLGLRVACVKIEWEEA